LDESILSYDDEESYVNRTQVPRHSELMDTFLHDLSSLDPGDSKVTTASTATRSLLKISEESFDNSFDLASERTDTPTSMETSNNKLIEALSKIPLGDILDHLGTENDFDAQFNESNISDAPSPKETFKRQPMSLESTISEIEDENESTDEKDILNKIDSLYAKLRQAKDVKKKTEKRVSFRQEDEIIQEPVPLGRLNVLREDLEEQMDKSSEISEDSYSSDVLVEQHVPRIIPNNLSSSKLQDEVRNMQNEIRNLIHPVKEMPPPPRQQHSIQDIRENIMKKQEKSVAEQRSEMLTANEQIRQLQALKERIDRQLSKPQEIIPYVG
jgi:hypothetical protein